MLSSQCRGERQLAYQVLAASSEALLAHDRGDLWDSGKVLSDETTQIEYAGGALSSGQRVWWKVRSWDAASGLPSPWSTNACFGVGLLEPTDWSNASWIGIAGYNRTKPCPMFRSPAFVLSNPVQRATLYVSAKGVFELWLNGQRVGRNVLAPEWTDYRKRLQYQTFDVTANLFSGSTVASNVLGAIVGEGWYSDTNSFPEMGQPAPYGRPCPQLALVLRVLNRDGTTTEFTTIKSWSCSTNGPIRSASIYGGELYDANAEGASTNWTWPAATVFCFTNALTASNVLVAQMVSQPNEPLQVTDVLTPVDSWPTTNERGRPVTIYDLGQNMVGWCALSLRNAAGHAGQKITLRHAERLALDASNLPLHHGPLDRHNLDYSLGEARQTDEYILNGEADQKFHPHFTYHGFRYVEVESPPGLAPADIVLSGCVIRSSVPETGQFVCSDPRITRLMDNIRWTIRGNLYGVMTDAPQRAEREGYLGSEMLIAQTAAYLFDLSAFYTKWVRDIRDAQDPGGGYAIYAPWNGNRYASWDPGWQVGGIIFPWQLYLNYGDTRMLAEHYTSATNWMNYLNRACPAPRYVWASLSSPAPPMGGNNISYGDWLNGDAFFHYPGNWPSGTGHASMTNLTAYGTAWAAYSADLLADMSSVLQQRAQGQNDNSRPDYYAQRQRYFAELADKFREGFTNDANGFVRHDRAGTILSIDNNCQAACVLALYFDLVPEDQRAALARELVYGAHGIENYNTNFARQCRAHLSTGNQFAARELDVLSRCGYTWKAYEVLTNAEFPSWLYWVDKGATTCWERWNSYLAGPGQGRGYADYNQPRQYSQRMSFNSFNSLPFGAVGEWLWRVVGGINQDSQSPGFKHVLFFPQAGGGVTWASSSFQSVHGLIECAWTNNLSDTTAVVRVTVPANTTAGVYLPAASPAAVTESGVPAQTAAGVLGSYTTNLPNWSGAATVFNVGSGTYCFSVSNATLLAQPQVDEPRTTILAAGASNPQSGHAGFFGALTGVLIGAGLASRSLTLRVHSRD